MATSTNTFLLILTFIGGTSLALNARDTPPENLLVHSAQITVEIPDAELMGDAFRSLRHIVGRYAISSHIRRVKGELYMPVDMRNGGNHACSPPINNRSLSGQAAVPWIALVERGGCSFAEKIRHSSSISNTTAVIVYDHTEHDTLITMTYNVADVASVFISKSDGDWLTALMRSRRYIGVKVTIEVNSKLEVLVDYPTKGLHHSSPIILYSCVATISLFFFSVAIIAVVVTFASRKNSRQVVKASQLQLVFGSDGQRVCRKSLLSPADRSDSGYCQA